VGTAIGGGTVARAFSFYAVRPDAIVLLGVATKKSRATSDALVRACNARIRRYDEAREG
jgi:hypothetical protein